MIRDLDIRALRSFIAVAEHGNVTAAAHQRALTQSAVSQQLKKLEAALGQRLLHRTRTGVGLTIAGKALIPLARKSIAINDEILVTIGQNDIGAQIRLGVAHDLVSMLLPKPLSIFHNENPRDEIVLVSASSAQLIAMLNSGDVDLAITTDRADVPEAHLLFASHLVWVGAVGGSAHALSPLPIAVSTEGCPFRQALAAALLVKGHPWKPMTQRGSLEAMFATVKADLAISALLPATIPPDLAEVTAGSLPTLPKFLIHLRSAKRVQSSSETTLCDILAQQFIGFGG